MSYNKYQTLDNDLGENDLRFEAPGNPIAIYGAAVIVFIASFIVSLISGSRQIALPVVSAASLLSLNAISRLARPKRFSMNQELGIQMFALLLLATGPITTVLFLDLLAIGAQAAHPGVAILRTFLMLAGMIATLIAGAYELRMIDRNFNPDSIV